MHEGLKTRVLQVYNSESKKYAHLTLTEDAIKDLKELFVDDGRTGKVIKHEMVQDFTWFLNSYIATANTSAFDVTSYARRIETRRREKEMMDNEEVLE